MEAVQFHPTAIVPVGILTTEGCRGDGGLLKDVDGYRFMPDYEPGKKELASRDVVSRRMTEHMRKGKGVPSPYGRSPVAGHHAPGQGNTSRRTCARSRRSASTSSASTRSKTSFPCVPPSTTRWAASARSPRARARQSARICSPPGEAACWDMHGFNRLGGNSVAETVVAGMIVGEYVADYCESRPR